ncbi:hypothetical protein QE152_g41343 [Popillia japonica]|uniref:Uncharacterized protein n=1 Tax=Popillia japonica TaxID=7064 RepID=A0AAW1GVC2_POPJA
MTVVTGVSGSGKSTLVRDIFYRALKRQLDECSDRPGEYVSMDGDINNLQNVEFVDQNPIGKSSRKEYPCTRHFLSRVETSIRRVQRSPRRIRKHGWRHQQSSKRRIRRPKPYRKIKQYAIYWVKR